jgi:hypothetical protein
MAWKNVIDYHNAALPQGRWKPPLHLTVLIVFVGILVTPMVWFIWYMYFYNSYP